MSNIVDLEIHIDKYVKSGKQTLSEIGNWIIQALKEYNPQITGYTNINAPQNTISGMSHNGLKGLKIEASATIETLDDSIIKQKKIRFWYIFK